MQKLTIEIDLDLVHGKNEAVDIIGNLIEEMERVKELAGKHILSRHASGLILSPLEDDDLVGNWRIDEK